MLKRNLSPLNHLQNLAVWNISWRKIQRITNISSRYACQTDTTLKQNTGKKPNLTYFGEKNHNLRAVFF